MARKCFYSFHFDLDSQRASQVRNIGALEGNQPASPNKWEEVKRGGEASIKKWIADNMAGRTCLVVLVGEQTAHRKWVKYEIEKAWNDGLGVVGVHIHGLKNLQGDTSAKGPNPFESFTLGNKKLSEVVKCYNPGGSNSKERYDWIVRNLANAVEEAIKIRNAN